MVSTPILVILLAIFLAVFLGLQPVASSVLQAQDITIMGVSLFGTGFQAFLALAIVFLEFVIIFFSLLDRIGDTIKAALKPLVSLLPLGLFIVSVQKTFTPILLSLLPEQMIVNFGMANAAINAGVRPNENYVAAAIENGSLTNNVVLTVAAMAAFALVSYATSRPTHSLDEIRRLRAENARLRKFLQ